MPIAWRRLHLLPLSITDMPRPIIIDTDLSFDDYVAILYLLQHPSVDVRALTVVNGVVHVKPGVFNARSLLKLVNQEGIPVAGGPEKPLVGDARFPLSWRLLFDYAPRVFLPRPRDVVNELSAVELIREQTLRCDKPLTFVALGPLTNLALVLQGEPALAKRFEAVFVSGGAIHVPGTIHQAIPALPNRVAEWNFYLDPFAADIVFKSGVPLMLIPLDVTHVQGVQPLLFGKEFVRQLRLHARSRASRFLIRLIYLWQLTTPQYPATPVWDGVVAAIVAEPKLGADWRTVSIRIVTQPKAWAGQTIIDEGELVNTHVCLRGNQAAFEAAFLALVGR